MRWNGDPRPLFNHQMMRRWELELRMPVSGGFERTHERDGDANLQPTTCVSPMLYAKGLEKWDNIREALQIQTKSARQVYVYTTLSCVQRRTSCNDKTTHLFCGGTRLTPCPMAAPYTGRPTAASQSARGIESDPQPAHVALRKSLCASPKAGIEEEQGKEEEKRRTEPQRTRAERYEARQRRQKEMDTRADNEKSRGGARRRSAGREAMEKQRECEGVSGRSRAGVFRDRGRDAGLKHVAHGLGGALPTMCYRLRGVGRLRDRTLTHEAGMQRAQTDPTRSGLVQNGGPTMGMPSGGASAGLPLSHVYGMEYEAEDVGGEKRAGFIACADIMHLNVKPRTCSAWKVSEVMRMKEKLAVDKVYLRGCQSGSSRPRRLFDPQ